MYTLHVRFQYQNCFFLSMFTEFLKKENFQCNGKILRGYPSLSEAKIGCKNNSNCSGVFDVDCDDYLFWSCEGKIESIDSTLSNELDKTLCLWERGTTSILTMIIELNDWRYSG